MFKFFFLLFILITFSSKADTYKLQCVYEKGEKKSIIIDEQENKINNNPGGSWNYRKLNENVYVYEVADLDRGTIIRFTIDLENLEEEQVIVKVPKKPNIEEILMLLPKFERGEVSYEEIDRSKRNSFEQWFKNPKSTKNKIEKNWRNEWEGGHPEEYVMYENNSNVVYQLSLIHRCDFIN